MSVNSRSSQEKAAETPFDRSGLGQASRIVVKVGSALLTRLGAGLEMAQIEMLCDQIAGLARGQREVILVSSGAVAEGCARLGWAQRPETVHELQAAAAVGQMGLAQAWESSLGRHALSTAMVMLTHEDLADRQRYLNARATLTQLISLGVIPVINENDTVATEEIRFGDNDTLAAMVANLVEADLLIILTDVEGLMDGDPQTHVDVKRISQAAAADTRLDGFVGASAGALGRGGMVTKLRAARLAARSGAHTVIAHGRTDQVLPQIVEGRDVGTLLTAQELPLTARKRWIAGHLRPRGTLKVDAGAARALVEQGVSLLAVGLLAVEGEFRRGDVVRCEAPDGRTIAQGLSNYDSSETRRLIGVRSEDFARHLEMVGEPELVHRDNLAVLV